MRAALITGSSRGIGREVALSLIKDGYRVIIHGKNDSKQLLETKNELKKYGEVDTISFDISNKKVIEKKLNLLLKKQSIDVLVNNAAISKDMKLINMSYKNWDKIMRVNLYGPYFLSRIIVPGMIKRSHGRIINISSIASNGAYGKTNYSASKAGLIGFSKSLALELAEDNVTVNVVSPGYIKSGMSASIPAKHKKEFIENIPMKRVGEPKEVANAVRFLASEGSSYITGAVIEVNGGWQI